MAIINPFERLSIALQFVPKVFSDIKKFINAYFINKHTEMKQFLCDL